MPTATCVAEAMREPTSEELGAQLLQATAELSSLWEAAWQVNTQKPQVSILSPLPKSSSLGLSAVDHLKVAFEILEKVVSLWRFRLLGRKRGISPHFEHPRPEFF